MHESVTFGFGEFELDALRFELRRSGSVVMVQPKVLRLLFHLVANNERSVSRRELLDALWPGEAVTVASVKRAIAGARRALGEDGEAESSIRTVRGHGYRFVGAVRALSGEQAPGAARVELATPLALPQPTAARWPSRRARELGAVVLWARCSNPSAGAPLWPALQMLREAEVELEPALLRALSPETNEAQPGEAALFRLQCSDLALTLATFSRAGPEVRLALLLEKGDALACLGRVAWARDAAASAARIALERRDTDGLVQVARLLGRLPAAAAEDPVQRSLLEAALSALPAKDARRPSIEALLARAQVWRRDPKLRATRATSALAAARSIGDSQERGEALRACAHALADPEFLPQRLAIAEELEVIGRDREDRQLLIASAATRVWAYCELGDMPGVDANIRALELLTELTRDPIARWNARAFRAMRAIVAGRLELAAHHAREALALGTKLGRDTAQRIYCTQMGGILRLEGRRQDAAELVREVSLRNPTIAGWQAALAGIEAELGRVDHAREVLSRLLDRDMALLLGDPYGLGSLAPAADLCALVGNAEQSKLLYDALLPYADRHGVIAMGANTHGPLARHLGRLALRMGDSVRAERHLSRAVEAAERCGSPTFLSLSELAYAQLLLHANRPGARERAAARTARALQLGRDHKLHAVVERARALAEHANLRLTRDRSGAA